MQYLTFFAVLTVVVIVSFVLVIYQYFGCHQRRRQTTRSRRQWFESTEEEPTSTETTIISFENSIKHLMPAYTYGDKEGLVGKGDGTCAVCLSEFMDGESLRLMPECQHSFHVPCIDMWLKSHPNCPLCRTDMTPSPSRSAAVCV